MLRRTGQETQEAVHTGAVAFDPDVFDALLRSKRLGWTKKALCRPLVIPSYTKDSLIRQEPKVAPILDGYDDLELDETELRALEALIDLWSHLGAGSPGTWAKAELFVLAKRGRVAAVVPPNFPWLPGAKKATFVIHIHHLLAHIAQCQPPGRDATEIWDALCDIEACMVAIPEDWNLEMLDAILNRAIGDTLRKNARITF